MEPPATAHLPVRGAESVGTRSSRSFNRAFSDVGSRRIVGTRSAAASTGSPRAFAGVTSDGRAAAVRPISTQLASGSQSVGRARRREHGTRSIAYDRRQAVAEHHGERPTGPLVPRSLGPNVSRYPAFVSDPPSARDDGPLFDCLWTVASQGSPTEYRPCRRTHDTMCAFCLVLAVSCHEKASVRLRRAIWHIPQRVLGVSARSTRHDHDGARAHLTHTTDPLTKAGGRSA